MCASVLVASVTSLSVRDVTLKRDMWVVWVVWGVWGVWGRCVSKFGNQVVTHSTFTRSRVDKPPCKLVDPMCLLAMNSIRKQIRCFAETTCLLPITLHCLSFSVKTKIG